MDRTASDTATGTPTMSPVETTGDATRHDSCLTTDVTTFLLGRVSMEELCQFCVLTALAPLHPWQMSIYTVGSDSLFRLAGSFGKGTGQDALHQYSCLDDPQVGAELLNGQPLATFPLMGMRPQQHLNISDLEDGPQVLWPLSTSHGLTGAIHIRFIEVPEPYAVSCDLAAIAAPIALAVDLTTGRDTGAITPSGNGHGTLSGSPDGVLTHPSLMGPWTPPATAAPALSVVRWGESGPSQAGPETKLPAKDLTARQLRVLSLMAKGMTNGQIARVLAFSESTVRQETMAIYRTLQVKGRAEAIDFGRTHGLIPTSP